MKSSKHLAFGLALVAVLALVVVPRALQTSAATSAPPTAQPKYQYVSVVAVECIPTEPGPWDFCLYTYNGTDSVATTPMEQVLTTYSSQGYQLFSITSTPGINQVAGTALYTLRKP